MFIMKIRDLDAFRLDAPLERVYRRINERG
jgi:hypothetical protein